MFCLLSQKIHIASNSTEGSKSSSIGGEDLSFNEKSGLENRKLGQNELCEQNIVNETHIYINQNNFPSSTTCFIHIHPSNPNFLINLHIDSLNISSPGRIIEISTGILHIFFRGLNYLQNTYRNNSATIPETHLNFSYSGIECSGNGRLIIDGGGTPSGNQLNAVGSYYSPGIGSSIGKYSGDNCDLIQIKSGNITAKSFHFGAAIGSGYGRVENSSNVNQIRIDGGFIETVRDSQGEGCGIGTGAPESKFSSNVGSIFISGGEITSNGLKYTPGIGASVIRGSNIQSNAGNIKNLVFKGGAIKSNYPNPIPAYSSSIGTGYGPKSDSEGGNIETINFTGSSVFAKHKTGGNENYAAVIGGGYGFSTNSSNIKEINIIEGEIDIINENNVANDFDGVGLGGGNGKNENSCNVENIRIGTEKTQLLSLNISSSSKKNPAIGSYVTSPKSGILGMLEIGIYINFLHIKSEYLAIGEKDNYRIGINLTYQNSKKEVNYSNPFIISCKFSEKKIMMESWFEFVEFLFFCFDF